MFVNIHQKPRWIEQNKERREREIEEKLRKAEKPKSRKAEKPKISPTLVWV
jgi:hypothetical protein